MESISKIVFLIILSSNVKVNMADDSFMTILQESFQYKLCEFTNFVAKWLEGFNDQHIGKSEIGKMLGYDVLKPKFGPTGREGKHMKKMSMTLLPLVFHVGATSTWMMLTSIMAVKSVAIGLLLLVFKIAVSSAKVASFFTALKAKHDHHHDWSWTPPQHDHGHVRSLTDIGPYNPPSWDSYTPEHHEVSALSSYKTIPTHGEHYENTT